MSLINEQTEQLITIKKLNFKLMDAIQDPLYFLTDKKNYSNLSVSDWRTLVSLMKRVHGTFESVIRNNRHPLSLDKSKHNVQLEIILKKKQLNLDLLDSLEFIAIFIIGKKNKNNATMLNIDILSSLVKSIQDLYIDIYYPKMDDPVQKK